MSISPDYQALRLWMVEDQLRSRDIDDRRVLQAMEKVPRHRFVPSAYVDQAYTDGPLPIGDRQTISQPYVVASMTEHLKLKPNDRVLEIGTGCGYQTAILCELAREVYTIEIVQQLQKKAVKLLGDLGYSNLFSRLGDGSGGWLEQSPFDAIIVAAAAPREPNELISQLAEGGRLVYPLATDGGQHLMAIQKTVNGIDRRCLYEVRFVPMQGDIRTDRD